MLALRARWLPLLAFAACARSVLVPAPSRDAGPEPNEAQVCTPERCNGVDEDCDGQVDEGTRSRLYRDGDGDGYGDTRDVIDGCPIGGRVEVGGDCDDTQISVSPAATEMCTGGLDEDCDGLVDCDDEDCVCTPPHVFIPPGRFFMGSHATEIGHDPDEAPRHEVEITRGFVMMSTEVTQGAWRALTGTSPSYFSSCGDQCPVESISWFEALHFANLLSASEGYEPCYFLGACTGTFGAGCGSGTAGWNVCYGDFECGVPSFDFDCKGWRLPTEAEWEYAARAGTETAFFYGDAQEDLHEVGWCSSNGDDRAHPVARLDPNPWGLYDIAGNVYEWTWDRDGSYPSGFVTDPIGTLTGRVRIMRGGAFTFGDLHCRSANRGSRSQVSRETVVGLRLVRTAP